MTLFHFHSPPPFRIKMVEPIKKTTKEFRKETLKKVGNNPFLLKSKDVFIDLLTDSGTGAMSDNQWSSIMLADESYAGSKSFLKLQQAVRDIFHYEHVIPCHQGRGAENLLFPILLEKRRSIMSKERGIFISNYHFDTTAAHVELNDCSAVNCICHEASDIEIYHPFKGNMNVEKLKEIIEEHGAENIVAIIITITCNSVGGQPVSMENIKAVSKIGKEYGIPLVMDAARFCENAWFIKERELAYENVSIPEIVREMFSFVDMFTMSCKKDALVNMGGLCCIKNDKEIYRNVSTRCIPYEGFITYGGLSGRDMEAMAVGLYEGMDYEYLTHRIQQVEYLGEQLRKMNVPIQYPPGGHAIFIDAKNLLSHIPEHEFPAQVLANHLYIEGGIRGVEIGSLLLGRDPLTGEQKKSPYEFLRLTIPRRVYTNKHMDYIVHVMNELVMKKDTFVGLEITYEAPILRHFTAQLKNKDNHKDCGNIWNFFKNWSKKML